MPLSVALRGREGGATAELGDEVAGCLGASTGGGDKPHVLAPIAFSSKDYGGDAEFDLSPTMRAGGHSDSHANAGVPPAIAYSIRTANTSSNGWGIQEEVLHTLDCTNGPAVCVTGDVTHTLKAEGFDASEDGTGRGQPIVAAAREVAGCITSNYGKQLDNSDTALGPNVAIHGMAVRRLTPVECERLQSFADGYTSIPTWNGWRAMGEDETPEGCIEQGLEVRQNRKTGKWRVKDVDGPRYKALGNSMCVYNMRWIGSRIDAQLRALEAA